MNIFLREMKATWKSLMFWTLGMLALLGASMWEYSGLEATGDAMSKMMEIYPKSLKAMFGMSTFDIGTLMGYFGVVLVFVYIMAGLHAVMLGANLVAKEERERTAEFLMVKPVKWENILRYKQLAGLVNILAVNLAAWAVSAAMLSHFSDEPVGADLLLIQVSLLFFQAFFLHLGLGMAAILKTPKAGQFATFIFIGFYFVKVAADLIDSAVLNCLTPFGFFGAQNVILEGSNWTTVMSAAAILAAIAMTWVAYKVYPKKDINT